MKPVSLWKSSLACTLSFLFAATAGMSASTPQSVMPVHGALPTLIPVTINNAAGDQFDPHVSGDWASYTSDNSIRYYNFATNTDAQIPLGSSARDLLSDVSGSRVVFARIIPAVKTAVMVFDAANPSAGAVEVDPAPGTLRIGSAIGANTVAYVNFGLGTNGELVAHDLVTGNSHRLSNDGVFDQNPSVSPDGTVVVWEHCPTSMLNCDVWQAVFASGAWTTSVVTAVTGHEANPDTNGRLVVYDAMRSGERDLFWKPVGSGAEVQLELPGLQENPSIAGDFVAFESRPDLFSTADLFVHDITRNRLYRITDTPLANEQLNDITVLPDGRIRVVWASDEDGFDQRNVKGATFEIEISPTDLLQLLIDTVKTFNLRQGIANSLDAKLSNVQKALETARSGDTPSACALLDAFINEVQAQSGKTLTVDQATQLVDLASQVRTALGCQ